MSHGERQGQAVDGPPTRGAADPDGQPELRRHLRPLVEQKRVVWTCVGAAVIGGVLVAFLSVPLYRATATIQIERRAPEVLNFRDVLNVESNFVAYAEFYQTQHRILRSRAVLERVVDDLDLPHRPEFVGRPTPPIRRFLGWLSGLGSSEPEQGVDSAAARESALAFAAANLAIRPLANTQLVEVSFLDRDPDLAGEMANAVVHAYERFLLEARSSMTGAATDFLAAQAEKLKVEIAESERALQELAQQKDILAITGDNQDVNVQSLAELNALLTEAKGRLALAEARHLTVRGASSDALPEILSNPLINSLKTDYAELQRRQAQMAERFKSDWPALRQLREEVEETRRRLETEIETVAAQVRAVAAADLRRSQAEVGTLRQKLDVQKGRVRRLHADAIDYAGRKAELESKRELLAQLLSRGSQTAVSQELQSIGDASREVVRSSNVILVDAAEVPRHPVRPRRFWIIFVSAFLGLLAGVGMALLVDHLDNTVKNEQHIEALTGLPVLAHIPRHEPLKVVPKNAEPTASSEPPSLDLGSHLEPQSSFAEAFKILRTSMLLVSPERPPRHVVVTSPEPGAGKSLVSLNIAIVFAQSGRRVLLIDADLRRSRCHTMLGLPNASGLSNLLTGNAALEDVIQETEIPGLTALTSGPNSPAPSELIGSPGMEALLARCSKEEAYDLVILDSPPALHIADAVVLAPRADATVVVVRAGSTQRETLTQAVTRLRRARARLVGAVLNAVPQHAGGYYGYYGYYGYRPDQHQRGGKDVAVTPRGRSSRKRQHTA